MEWISVKDRLPRQYQCVLTIHLDDLYPVCAYLNGYTWYREIEGPEDIYQSESGRHGVLYRAPTHWALWEPPNEE